MNLNTEPLSTYSNRISQLNSERDELKKKADVIAWSRFFALLLMCVFFFYLKPINLFYSILSAVIFFAIFLRLVILAANNKEKIQNLDLLLRINHEEIEISRGEYHLRADGSSLKPPLHDYADDLDIFGRASLFQYLNRTNSEQGNKKIAEWLLSPSIPNTIYERQEAAKELSSLFTWRQQLQAYGMNDIIRMQTELRMSTWIAELNHYSTKPFWKLTRFILPAIILVALILNIVDILPSPFFYFMVFVFFIIASSISKKVTPLYLKLDKMVKEILVLSNTSAWIENQSFNAPLLQQLQKQFSGHQKRASIEVKGLKKILDRFDYRLNPVVFIPLNTFLLWDLQQVFDLEKWKDENRDHVLSWFHTLAEFEALCTIANFHFNHPSFSFPILDEEHGSFIAKQIGHPLIDAHKRICSSFETRGKAKLALVTGSNMAGKSTFLRSIGVNMVLAMMGAPVCAESLVLAPMRVISSMRVTDNLEESTSTFYAELKKLKHIIQAVNAKEKVFLLLDEILRGTNSLDRHTGSRALIKQLIEHDGVGVLATHDLELARLVETYPGNIHNYHFDVQVEGEELYFDYKLKEGVCQSLNASILMKKIGIEL